MSVDFHPILKLNYFLQLNLARSFDSIGLNIR
jgi:hypothetical protein